MSVAVGAALQVPDSAPLPVASPLAAEAKVLPIPPTVDDGNMRAVLLNGFGGPEQMYIGQAPMPSLRSGELLVKVHCFALNRADTSQRRGQYPAPAGESSILGMEASGEVVKIGDACESKFAIGDRVMSLVSGGCYAEYVAVSEKTTMPIPSNLSYSEAAAIPEVFLTAFQMIHTIAKVQPNETVLIHAGASGVGTAAIQLCNALGARPVVTAGSAEKIAFCEKVGALTGFNYKSGPFAPALISWAAEKYGQAGVNVILDCVGGSHFKDNLLSIMVDGRWVLYATMGGAEATIDLRAMLMKRVQLQGTTLRSRPLSYKAQLVADFTSVAMPLLINAKLKPVIDTVLPFSSIVQGHQRMEADLNAGKIIIRII